MKAEEIHRQILLLFHPVKLIIPADKVLGEDFLLIESWRNCPCCSNPNLEGAVYTDSDPVKTVWVCGFCGYRGMMEAI